MKDKARQFIEFLKEQKAYQPFVDNLMDFKHITISEYLKNIKSPYGYVSVISEAFMWHEYEGDWYWMNISALWYIKLCEIHEIETKERQ